MNDSQIIVTKLTTHATLKNVVPFGESPLPAPPYSVVKVEPTGLGYTRVRVIGHYAVNQSAFLETYVKKDVFDLLAYKLLTDGTRKITLEPLVPGQLVTANSDSTISQEAVFRLPEMAY